MSEQNGASFAGFDDLGAVSGNEVLIAEWCELATGNIIAPEYRPTPTFDEYLIRQAPQVAGRLQTGQPLRRRHQRELTTATVRYQSEAQRIQHNNDGTHADWLTGQAPVFVEMCGLAIAGGDEDLARHYFELASDRGAVPAQSDKIGLALLANGQQERAKSVLLGHRRTSSTNLRAHNLLDAYAWSNDPEYRQRFLLASRTTNFLVTTFLIARLARLDISRGVPVDDLFDISDEGSGSRLALALTVTAAQAPDKDRFERYLARTLPKLRAPETKTHVPDLVARPAPQRQSSLIRRAREKGLFGIMEDSLDAALELPGKVVDGLADIMEGTGPRATQSAPPSPRQRHTPEYRKFLRNVAPVIAATFPLLQEHSGFVDEGYGNPAGFSHRQRRTILTGWANAGYQEAAVSLVEYCGKSEAGMYGYRNLIRDMGSAAMVHLPYLSPDYRRAGAYYTLIAAAARGEHIPAARLPEAKDEYGRMQTLYQSIAMAAHTQPPMAEEKSRHRLASGEMLATELEIIDPRNLTSGELDTVLTRVRTLNNPKQERTILLRLAERLGVPPGQLGQ